MWPGGVRRIGEGAEEERGRQTTKKLGKKKERKEKSRETPEKAKPKQTNPTIKSTDLESGFSGRSAKKGTRVSEGVTGRAPPTPTTHRKPELRRYKLKCLHVRANFSGKRVCCVH